MKHKYKPLKIALAVSALAIGLLFDGDFDRLMKEGSSVSNADARRVGRPGVGAGGVGRGVARRTIRRGAYVAVIPAGCHYGTYYGYHAYHCGGHYYQSSGGGYHIVHF